ncbi:hypothetical protein [Cupriavidus sp. WS]|uniref:hypothetical protein n=1 Tax=Cupriavidus sp. WS TaxID=1312922 RepID=UPI00036C8EB3|nr:hypothetical protein [Cupriavidus sp. WS]
MLSAIAMLILIMAWFIAGFFGTWFVVGILALMPSSSIPTLAEFLAANPTCKTHAGISCKFCGSKSIRLWRDESGYAIRQQHYCNHCNALLYRSG